MGRSLSLRIYAIVSTVCLILTSVLIHQPIAHAGTITISNVRVESDNLPIKQYSQVDVKWDWYAGNVADGQKFSVAFPEVLSLKANQGIELKDKDNEVGGTCDADNNTRTVTCTFNDRFSAKDDVRGTFSIKVQASKAQKSKDVTFQVDGSPKVVRLPGDDGQDGIIGADVHVPKTFKKEGWAEDDKVHARWTITIPGSELVQHAPNQDAIIDDELSLKAGDVGHKFIEGYGAYAREFTADQVDNPREKGIAITYNQAIQEERKQVITVKRPNGGWKADRFYQVSYMSIATDGKIPTKATDIANKARLRGTALEVSDIASFAQDASGTITGVDRGTFELRKVIDSGTLPSPALENDAKFTVKVTIDSDDDSFDETYEVQVPANGDVVKGKKKLPAGTRVTLEEVIPANSPVTFDAPKFTATNPSDAGQLTGGSPSVTLTTVEDRNIGVTLTNTLTPPTSGFFFDKAIAIMTEDGANVAEGKDAEIAELKKRLPEFTVHYTCAAGDKNYDGEVKIKSDGTPSQPVSNIPVGAQCRFIEEDVEAVGYRWHYHIRKNDHGDVLPTRAETPNVFDYTVTNERQHLRVTNKFIPTKNPVGKFKIVKTVEDPHKVIPPNEKKRYVFEYRCVPDRPKGPPSQPRQQVPQADDANEPAPVQFTLTVDGAGEVTSPEIPVGYVCSITERASSADVKDATRTTSITPESVKISADQVQTFTVNNVYASDLGDFTITKKLDNPDNVAVGDKDFTFHYVCMDKNRTEATKVEGDLVVKANGTATSKKIPHDFNCVVNEVGADVAGADLKTSGLEEVTIVKGATKSVTATNTYTAHKGKFKIVKTVEDPHKVIPPNEKKRYVFEYRCVPDRPKGPPSQPRQQVPQADDANEPAPVQFTLTVDGAGEVTSPEIPVGYVCSITERASSADVKDATRTTSITPESVKISADQVQTFTVNNVYASDLGDFTITKKLDNPDNVAVGDKDFTFHYVCMDKNRTEATKVEGDLVVKANGTATSKKIPHDFNCVVNEVGADVAGADLKTSGLEEVTIVKGATKSVTATNTYTALKGSVKVTKELAGSAKDLDVIKHKTFTVGYVCTKEGKETSKGEVKLKVDEPATIKDIVVGSRCTFTEDTKDVAVDGAIFVEDESIVRAEATVEDERSEASARIKNSYNNLGTVEITKEVVGLVAGSSSNKSKEYQFTATWGIGNESKKETFTLKDGETHKLPQLPVGTLVTLRETMPTSDTFTSWATPRFGSDTAGAVKDNGDGTATITVKAESSKATVVKVTNSANIPWWWFVIPIVPLIPLPTPPAPSVQKPPAPLSATPTPSVPAPKTCDPHVPASGTPGEPGGYSGGHGANGTDKGVPCVPQKGIPAKAQSGNPTPEKQNPRNLANTGASVIGVSVLALLVVTAGAVMIIRSRRS